MNIQLIERLVARYVVTQPVGQLQREFIVEFVIFSDFEKVCHTQYGIFI
jgi:hypothetical protein